MDKNNFSFSHEEQETFVNWDYPAKQVHIYTTKQSVFEKVAKRVEGWPGVSIQPETRTITVPMAYARQPLAALKSRKAKCFQPKVNTTCEE